LYDIYYSSRSLFMEIENKTFAMFHCYWFKTYGEKYSWSIYFIFYKWCLLFFCQVMLPKIIHRYLTICYVIGPYHLVIVTDRSSLQHRIILWWFKWSFSSIKCWFHYIYSYKAMYIRRAYRSTVVLSTPFSRLLHLCQLL